MKARAVVTAACLAMFVLIAVLDVLTPQRLVAAILLNIPVALSGLAFSRRLTVGLMIAAIGANVFAAWFNARTEAGFDPISLWNRVLLALSFALVGGMTVMLSQASKRLEAARLQEQRLRDERDRERIEAVSRERSFEAALRRSAELLASAIHSGGVILAAAAPKHFAAPRAAVPASLASWGVGGRLPDRLLGVPPETPRLIEQPGEYGLNANRAVIAGLEWPGQTHPVLIALLEPAPEASARLGVLLPDLASALERAELGERLEAGRFELERRAGVIRDLVYAFSHDLRTPLVASGVNMRLALEGAFGELPEAYRKTLVNGMEANEDLLKLADSLLMIARLESGESLPRFETLDLETLARSAAARIGAGARLEWHRQGELRVTGNGAELRRVIQNLIDNAAHFAPPGSSVDITLIGSALPGAETSSSQNADSVLRTGFNPVRLEVADRGPGVPVSLEPRLFQRFSTGRAGGGTGLGLYLARRIVEAHGGRIGYHPRVGGGSVFWLELPGAA